MAIGDDLSVTGFDIRWTGAAETYTVLEFHRWLQDLADDAVAAGDDILDITDLTPSERSTDNIIALLNGYNIDDTVAEHLFDGSISQASGNTLYSGLVVVGSAPAGTQLQLVQNHELLTNYWGTGLNADAGANILLRVMVKTRENGVDIDGRRLRVQAREENDTNAEFSLTLGLGNSTAAIFTSADLNASTDWATISAYDQFSNTEGLNLIDVDGNGTPEDYYSQYDIGGGTVPAAPIINDLYEWTKWRQGRGTLETIHSMNGELFRGVTHSLAYDAEVGNPATNDEYVWGLEVPYDVETGLFVVGEAVNIGTARGRILGLDDDGTTGTLIVSIEAGTPVDNDAITGLTSGATALVNGTPTGQATGGGAAIVLAVDDEGTSGNLYWQLTKGSAPSDNTILYNSADATITALVNGAPVSRTISPEYIGASTGSSIIGAYMIGIAADDLSASDQLFDSTGALVVPPNNVTFTVNGLVSGEDRVLVGPESGGVLQEDQLSAAGAQTAGASTLVVNEAIPLDTPSSGTIRVFNGDTYDRVEYTSFSGSTFTLTGTLPSNVADAANVFISYIDVLAVGGSASFTSVFSGTRSLFVRVRDGQSTPIRTFETTGTLGSAGGSTTAIRTSDA